jgi:AraC-like DNA-binding protein
MLFFFQPFQLHHVYAEVSPECPYVRTIFYADPVMIEGLLQAYPARYALFDMMWKGRYEQPAFDLSTQTEVMEWICKSYNEAREKGRGEDPEEIALLLLQLLSCIRAAQGSGSGPAAEAIERRVPRYSETVMRWIEEHYREEISLETLAEETHLSKFYVSRIFREETGSSITDYLTARRIKQACRLLQTTDLSVEQIGIRVGYPNASYFIQLFKKVVGVTPLKYRNKYVV